MNVNDFYAKLGKLVQRKRKELEFTQSELATKLGMSRASLANIETGRQKVLVHHLYKFAEVLKLKPSDFLPTYQEPEKETLTEWAKKLPTGLDQRQTEQIINILEKTKS